MKAGKHKRKKIIIATIKTWNVSHAEKFKNSFKKDYDVFVIANKEDLNYKIVNKINPEYIFFPHWSWLIPKDLYSNFNCVVFHMTDLPYGRGGSPLQNLILNKVYDTKISAIKVDGGIDTGGIYLKENCNIGLGTAEEILQKVSGLIFLKMIPFILENNPEPCKQKGKIVSFKRRVPGESNLTNAHMRTLHDLYDFIRMLDGEGYPKAFLKLKNFKLNFSEVHKKSDKLIGRFEIVEDYEE